MNKLHYLRPYTYILPTYGEYTMQSSSIDSKTDSFSGSEQKMPHFEDINQVLPDNNIIEQLPFKQPTHQ